MHIIIYYISRGLCVEILRFDVLKMSLGYDCVMLKVTMKLLQEEGSNVSEHG